MESRIVTAVGISINGHHPVHGHRIRHAMELEVLRHHATHGEITEGHAEALRAKLAAAYQRELDAIVAWQ